MTRWVALASGLFFLIAYAMPVYAGTWGHGAFENDHALDWVYDVEKSGTAETVRDALKLSSGQGHIDATDAEEALVAVEIVAASLGNPAEDFPDELKGWLQRQSTEALRALVPDALDAIDRIIDPKQSELYALWDEQDDAKAWLAHAARLKSRLKR